MRTLLGKTWIQKRLAKKRNRFVLFNLVAAAVGYTVVFVLTNYHLLSTTTANVTVSKSMAPVGLALNSLALTGRLIPTRRHASNWVISWLPSSTTTSIYLIFLVSTFGFEGITARAVAGLTFFPLDYALKKWVIFGKYGELVRYHITKTWISFKFGGLIEAAAA